MRKAITPVISIILLLVMTVSASLAAYFWMGSVQSDIQQTTGASIEASTISSCNRLNIISMRGDEVVIQNVGCDTVNNVSLFLNGVLTSYDLSSPLGPGDATTIAYTAQSLDERLEVIIALNNGNTAKSTIPKCTIVDGCINIEETFEIYPIGMDVGDGIGWTNIGNQDGDANATIVLWEGSKAALFSDSSDTKIAGKMYTFATLSPGTGKTTIDMNIDLPNPNDNLVGLFFMVIFYDESDHVIQMLVLGNGFCGVIEVPETVRSFFTEPGGGGEWVRWANIVTYEGRHDWTFEFDEDAETIRYFINGVEIFANDGSGGAFNSYYQESENIAKMQISTGVPLAMGGTGSENNNHVYVDNINAGWI